VKANESTIKVTINHLNDHRQIGSCGLVKINYLEAASEIARWFKRNYRIDLTFIAKQLAMAHIICPTEYFRQASFHESNIRTEIMNATNGATAQRIEKMG
jgi:hypothetical protein